MRFADWLFHDEEGQQDTRLPAIWEQQDTKPVGRVVAEKAFFHSGRGLRTSRIRNPRQLATWRPFDHQTASDAMSETGVRGGGKWQFGVDADFDYDI